MRLLALIWAELVGLFMDDEFLAVAILGVVLVAALMSLWLHVSGVAVGGMLLLGCLAVLLASVYRGAGKQ